MPLFSHQKERKMQRNIYDLTHQVHRPGQIGRLQTLSIIPVVAGDSFEFNVDGIMRMTPLRRELTMDSKVDICYFYRPHRHCYGDDWIDFIKGGLDETIDLDTFTMSGEQAQSYLGYTSAIQTYPKWVVDGYFSILNRYFKMPSRPDYQPQKLSGDAAKFGLVTTRIGSQMTRPMLYNQVNSSDYTYAAPVSGTANIDIRAIDQIRALYRTEIEREWFAQRYSDIMNKTFGSKINTDADERPELFWRHTEWSSGKEIDGTAEANLGQFTGKTAYRISHNVPRKYFPEHGAIFVMAVVRFPPVHYRENHHLCRTPQPSYKEISGDPEILMNEPPIPYNPERYFQGSEDSNISITYEPYGNWYRHQPNSVHPLFDQNQGYPFISSLFDTHDDITQEDPSEFWDIFQTSELGQWRIHAQLGTTAYRRIPEIFHSIYAGTE